MSDLKKNGFSQETTNTPDAQIDGKTTLKKAKRIDVKLCVIIVLTILLFATNTREIKRWRRDVNRARASAALTQFYRAMIAENGEDALKFAELAKKYYQRNRSDRYITCERHIALAKEMMGDYDGALEIYRADPRYATDDWLRFHELRIMLKTNKPTQAFVGYCQIIEQEDKAHPGVGVPGLHKEIKDVVKRHITIETKGVPEAKLTVFPTYVDFLDFMEKTYKKLGQPTKYAKAMETFRIIANLESGVSDVPKRDGETSAEAAK